jgi:hypothetical protein
MTAMGAAFVFGDDRLNLTNEFPTCDFYARTEWQPEKRRVIRTKINVAEVAQHKRKPAEDAILGVGVLSSPRLLNFSRMAATLHARADFANL